MPNALDTRSSETVAEITISDELAGHRLDWAVSRELGLSRSSAQKLIRGGRVAARDGRRVKPSLLVDAGAVFVVTLPPVEKLDLEPEDVPFDVVHADRDIIVVDKPAGLVVHPAPGHWRGTLVHGLLYRFPEMGAINNTERPGIVHRLDATTSGLLVIARSDLANAALTSDFKERRVGKQYIALCHGAPRRDSFTVDLPIARDPNDRVRMAVVDGGREAVTDFDVLSRLGRTTLLKCTLHTGRTHQIRVHAAAIGCPLVGDELYAPRRPSPFAPPRVFLHAWRLSFRHPRDRHEMNFLSRLPAELVAVLKG